MRLPENMDLDYDPNFLSSRIRSTTAELDPEKKNELSHRGKALRLMREIIERKNVAGRLASKEIKRFVFRKKGNAKIIFKENDR